MRSAKGTFRSREQLELQSMIFPSLILLFVFAYLPMYGVVIAFKDFQIGTGIWNSPWVGLKYFNQFLTDPNLWDVLRNTLVLNIIGTLVCFPAPILLAVLINELKAGRFKKVTQTISYLPHFLSWVIYSGLVLEMLRPTGVLSNICVSLGIFSKPTNFMANGTWFYPIFILSTLVKNMGYGSIIYVAALAGVDQQIYEAAEIDGCNRLQRIIHISLPCISGTVAIMLILQIGSLLNTGIEQILMFQNGLNSQYSETLDTYVYKLGIGQGRMSYSAAVGFMKSIVSVLLLVIANFTTKRLTEKSLF